jgi:hypothetical protein
VAVVAGIATIGLVGDGPNSVAVVVAAADPRWGIHHAVLWRSTARTTAASGSRHHPLPLFLIGLSNDLHHPLLVDGCTRQLIVQQVREMYQALLQMDGEPYMVQVGLLFIRVDVVCAI